MLIAKLNTEVYIVSTMDMSISFGLMQLRKKKKIQSVQNKDCKLAKSAPKLC